VFPYRDNLATGGWPFGVASLVAILCLVNIPLFLSPEWHNIADAAGGFIPLLFSSKPFLSSYRLITATALHGDIFHLAGNCLFLVVFGRTLERLFRARLLLLLFPTLGVAGFLAEWATDAASPVPVIGASGTIAALMGAYLPLFPGARIRILFWFGWFWRRFTLPAWAFLPYWMGLQLLSIAMGAQDGVAYAVHAGSFAAGAIAAIIWKTSYMGADEKLIEFKRLAFELNEPNETPTSAEFAPMRKTETKSKYCSRPLALAHSIFSDAGHAAISTSQKLVPSPSVRR
jgi:membrane associated rhomboid family serine protease